MHQVVGAEACSALSAAQFSTSTAIECAAHYTAPLVTHSEAFASNALQLHSTQISTASNGSKLGNVIEV